MGNGVIMERTLKDKARYDPTTSSRKAFGMYHTVVVAITQCLRPLVGVMKHMLEAPREPLQCQLIIAIGNFTLCDAKERRREKGKGRK